MESEENGGRDAMIQRVLEEDDDGGKADALIVLKKAIQKYSRNGNQFPGARSMSYPVYQSGTAYLKQFGLTHVTDAKVSERGIFISSSSAFTNLGELYDYIND